MMPNLKQILWAAAFLPALLGAACKETPPPEREIPVAARVVSFTALPQQVEAGASVTLAWNVEDATRVAISTSDGTAIELPDATQNTGAVSVKVEETTVFILVANGAAGSDSMATSVLVGEEPGAALFSAVPGEIRAGESSTLVWNFPGAEQVTVTAGAEVLFTGAQPSGSLAVKPAFDTTYAIDADGRTASATVRVTPAIFVFTASARTARPGDVVTLSWSVGGATRVIVEADGRGELANTTDASQIADGSVDAVIPDDLPVADGLVTYTLRASRQEGKEQVSHVTVYVGVDPVISAFTAPAFVKVGMPYPISWRTVNGDQLDVKVDGVVVHTALSQAEVNEASLELPPPAQDVEVTLEVRNARGGVASRSAIVSPVDVPVFNSFTISTPVVQNGGDAATLQWDVDNARRLTITDSRGRQVVRASGKAAETGTVEVYPNEPLTYTLSADNTVGDVLSPSPTVSVTVTNPAGLVFSPATAPAGAQVAITGSTVVNGGTLYDHTFVAKNAAADAFVDISTTGTVLPFAANEDTDAQMIHLEEPFSFSWFGRIVGGSSVSVAVDGWMVFAEGPIPGPSTPSTSVPGFYTTIEPLAIAPWLRDLQTDAATRILWQVDGTGASRRLIVQWDDIQYYNSPERRATFQAQVYADGQVIFAYDSFTGLTTSSDRGAIGIINADETGARMPASNQLDANGLLANGDRLRLFGQAVLPVGFTASSQLLHFRQSMGSAGAFLDIEDTYPLFAPNQFFIAEINYNPVAGQEEWFEVANTTASAIDLSGWYVDFGASGTFTIPNGTSLPAGDRLVFGQSAGSAEGAQVDVVYGTTFAMPDASGSLSIGVAGATYATSSWTTAGTAGVARVFDPPNPGLRFSSATPPNACPATASYGTNGQLGTPGTGNATCFAFPYRMAAIAGSFQSILSTGTQVPFLTTDDAHLAVALTRAVPIFGQAVSTLYVSTNGFATTAAITTSYSGNNSAVSTTNPNGVLAPFWDDLQANTTASMVAWQQFDPDGTPLSGDEYTLLSWENWKRFGTTSSLNFQIRFVEGTGDIEFHYGTMTASSGTRAQGSEATTWLENASGTAALVYNVNSATAPGIAENSGIRFSYAP